jgi:hypothetical protein
MTPEEESIQLRQEIRVLRERGKLAAIESPLATRKKDAYVS